MTRLYVKESHALGQIIKEPGDVVKYFQALTRADQESFWVVGLDAEHKAISADMVALGGINWASVDIRVAFRRLLVAGASAYILIHNHPSGNPEPSREDIALTQRFREAGNLLELRIVDHVVIASRGWRSAK